MFRTTIFLFIFMCIFNLFPEQKRKEAIASSNELTQALVDHLNVG